MLRASLLRFATAAAAVALSLAFACQSGVPEGVRADRVVLVSYDAVGADLARQWLEDGTAAELDGLRGMAEQGLWAQRLRMVNPTLTAVQHLTLATGADASGTGVVSNLFHRPGTPITDLVSGFNASSEVPPLWAAGREAGLRVATLMWPGADNGAPDRRGDFGTTWPGPPVAPAEVLDLVAGEAGTTGEVPSADGLAPRLWRLEIDLGDSAPASVEVLVALVDSEPDGLPRYDTVAMRRADSDDWSYAGEFEWLDLSFEAQGPDDDRPRPYGAWCKVLRIDRLEGALRFFRGGANRLTAYPAGFEDRLAEAVGPWPGEANSDLVDDWWLDLEEGIDLDTFIEQGERLDRYLDRILAWVLAEEDADLVLAYHSSVDVYQHACLITDQLQWAYSPGRALAAREGLKQMGRSVDRSVAAAWAALDPSRDALVVVSDHGQLPIFELLRPKRVLAEAGLLTTVGEGSEVRVAADTPMMATAGGAAIHLYLNQQGREPSGVVTPQDAPELLRRAARAFADLEVEGRPVVERIVGRDEAAAVGLDHPNTGDLVVFLAPGFGSAGGLDGPALEPSRHYGQHGFLASHDAMCGVLFARGPGLKRERVREQPATVVAPMVARWLGFELDTR
jgi:predicted AlkP superfamily phosphohydrolase/phosphomutase